MLRRRQRQEAPRRRGPQRHQRRRHPRPPYLANAQETATTAGALVRGIAQIADGVQEMRKVDRETIGLGVDQIKLRISGEEITGSKAATDTYITEEELQVAVDEAHRRHVRVCTRAHSRDSVIISLKTGVDMIYHASYIADESMDMLEAAEKAGYAREHEIACKAIQEMRRRGIANLPGGDYGFAWTPRGTYARDLDHFVRLFGYTGMEAIIAATALGGELFEKPNEPGKVLPGFYADFIMVDGNPLEDMTVLQDITKITAVMTASMMNRARFMFIVDALSL
ncbi:hypothetical protein [Arthrobacter sp. ok362]|uniref:hypothetical protein n=1 Tax=Arthrobacter sp. ok362 TaxID=1761745 RepID=UPI0020C8F0E1|nr:hypothetical protein [Arthrobacter sp. ok362]